MLCSFLSTGLLPPWLGLFLHTLFFLLLYQITRDIEIKHKLTITRGEVGGDNRGEEGGGSSRNMYKGHMVKIKGKDEVGEGGVFGWGGV